MYKGFADGRDWLKAIFLITCFVLLALWAGKVQAAEVTLEWAAVDFASVGSDPEKSGYKLYVSSDEGATKELVDDNVPMAATSYGPFDEDASPGKLCYFLTAFNQVDESDYSEPACGYIATDPPPVPSGLNRLLREIISRLDTIIDKM